MSSTSDHIQGVFPKLNKQHLKTCQPTYKRRIYEVNDEFNVVLEINPDAEHIAAKLDRERRDRKSRGPLHGLPILLKDNIFTDDHTATSAGSYALLGCKAPREATVATKLREAGAILLGKVNLSEWANFRSGPENGSNGWSARGGQTYGAFYRGMDPEGSSSGSAVSTVLGLAFAAVGTETDGSIVSPTQRSNVVGVAPTTGLVARDGITPLSTRQDTVGPLARTVKCAAHLLTAIAGSSAYDAVTDKIPFESIPNYAKACQGACLDGLRIGVPRDAIAETDAVVMEAFNEALKTLDSLGATIIENVKFSGAKEWADWDDAGKRLCLQAEFKHSIESWLSDLVENPNNIHTLADIIDFTKNDQKECYPERDIQRWKWAQEGAQVGSHEYTQTLDKMYRLAGKQGITGAMDQDQLNVLVYPTNIDPPTTFAARLGLPAISVPLGFYPASIKPVRRRGDVIAIAPNVPFGITFTGKTFTEEVLFRVAYVYEQNTRVRGKIQPYKMPSTELEDVV